MKRWIVIALFSAIAGSAAAQDTVGWHTVRQGETLEGITAHYLGSPASWRENWRLNPDIKDPDRLKPGQRIRVILARTLPARFARVEDLARRVERKPEPDPWVAARRGDVLAPRHGVQTFEASSASLHFDDETRLTLTENSLVFLRDMRAVQPKRDRSEIEVVTGSADLDRPAKTARTADIQITSGTATTKPVAGPRGTSARVRTEERSAQVMVYRGDASVTSAGASVTVPQGMGVAVPPDQKPPQPERLLPAPAIATVDVRNATPELRWKRVGGAKSYTVEICRDAKCGELIARDADVEGTSWSPAAPLAAGAMFWRVTARAASGLDGYPAIAAPLVVQLAIAGRIVVDGKPAAGVPVAAYRDDGDGAPDEQDVLAARTSTAEDGRFRFASLAGDGLHWVVVDSRGFPGGGWPEQVSCPGGPCPGGRSPKSDDARSLETAEHLAGLRPQSPDALFEFSYDAVTSTADEGQGTLRQFIANANARGGAHAMRFFGSRPWSTIELKSPLPPVTAAGTVIDGGRSDRPPLVIDFAGARDGFVIEAPATLRNLALVNAALHVRASSALTMENSVIGLLPNRTIPVAGVQRRGIEVAAGTTSLRNVLFSQLPDVAIDVAAAAALDADSIEVRSCGFGVGVPPVRFRGTPSPIRNSFIEDATSRNPSN